MVRTVVAPPLKRTPRVMSFFLVRVTSSNSRRAMRLRSRIGCVGILPEPREVSGQPGYVRAVADRCRRSRSGAVVHTLVGRRPVRATSCSNRSPTRPLPGGCRDRLAGSGAAPVGPRSGRARLEYAAAISFLDPGLGFLFDRE